jgi:hypothetical protein
MDKEIKINGWRNIFHAKLMKRKEELYPFQKQQHSNKNKLYYTKGALHNDKGLSSPRRNKNP